MYPYLVCLVHTRYEYLIQTLVYIKTLTWPPPINADCWHLSQGSCQEPSLKSEPRQRKRWKLRDHKSGIHKSRIQGPAWEKPMRFGPWEKTGEGEFAHFEEWPPPCSRIIEPMCRKSSNGTRRPTWINKEILTTLKYKKNAHKRWEWGQVSRDKCRDTALVCKDRLGKVKFCLELKIARDKKCFYKQ